MTHISTINASESINYCHNETKECSKKNKPLQIQCSQYKKCLFLFIQDFFPFLNVCFYPYVKTVLDRPTYLLDLNLIHFLFLYFVYLIVNYRLCFYYLIQFFSIGTVRMFDNLLDVFRSSYLLFCHKIDFLENGKSLFDRMNDHDRKQYLCDKTNSRNIDVNTNLS